MDYPTQQEGLTSLELLQHDLHLLKHRVQQLEADLAERDRVLDMIRNLLEKLQ